MESNPNGALYATFASFCWYASSGMACYSIMTSTLAAVALAITPESRIRVVGRKLLYCWVIPFQTTMGSVLFMGLGMWTDCEKQRKDFLEETHNLTGPAALATFEHGGIVIWSVRLFMTVTGLVCFVMIFIAVFCGERVEKFTGLESTSLIEEEAGLKESKANKGETEQEGKVAITKVAPVED